MWKKELHLTTLSFVRSFQEQFSPDLDIFIETLEMLEKVDKFETPQDENDDCTVSTQASCDCVASGHKDALAIGERYGGDW